METAEFNLPGMTCETCAGKIETAITQYQGIFNIKFDFKTRNVNVTFDENMVDSNSIKSAIKNAGYEVV